MMMLMMGSVSSLALLSSLNITIGGGGAGDFVIPDGIPAPKVWFSPNYVEVDGSGNITKILNQGSTGAVNDATPVTANLATISQPAEWGGINVFDIPDTASGGYDFGTLQPARTFVTITTYGDGVRTTFSNYDAIISGVIGDAVNELELVGQSGAARLYGKAEAVYVDGAAIAVPTSTAVLPLNRTTFGGVETDRANPAAGSIWYDNFNSGRNWFGLTGDMLIFEEVLTAEQMATLSDALKAHYSPSGAHRYWRVFSVNAPNDGYMSIAELQMFSEAAGPNIATTAQAIAGAERAGFEKEKAFDGNTTGNNSWGVEESIHAAEDRWVGQDFGSPVALHSISLKGRSDIYSDQTPTEFYVEWSDNGVDWYPAWSVWGEAAFANGEERTYTPTNGPLPVANTTILNPGAESGNTDWTFTGGVTTSGTEANGAPRTGSLCFYGGVNSAFGTMTQSVSIHANDQTAVDLGARDLLLSWYQGSHSNKDTVHVLLAFYDADGKQIGAHVRTEEVAPETWTQQSHRVTIPPLTRTFHIEFVFTRYDGSNNNGYVDDISHELIANNILQASTAGTAVILGTTSDRVVARKAQNMAIFAQPNNRTIARKARHYAIVETT